MKKKLISILIILAIFVGSGALVFSQSLYDYMKEDFENFSEVLDVNVSITFDSSIPSKYYEDNVNINLFEYTQLMNSDDEISHLLDEFGISLHEIYDMDENSMTRFLFSFLIAHELGHAYQTQVSGNPIFDLQDHFAGKTTRRIELQADCIAGFLLRDRREEIEPEKLLNFFQLLNAIGDELSQKREVPNYHGTGKQRVNAFTDGFYSDFEWNGDADTLVGNWDDFITNTLGFRRSVCFIGWFDTGE